MADIFRYIPELSEDELRIQIALLDNVNLPNAVKETGHRFLAGLVDIANTFTETFGIKNTIEYEARKVADIVKEDHIRYKSENKEHLEILLKEKMYDLCRDFAPGIQVEEKSHEELSRILTDEAAAACGINKYMTPAHKIEQIGIKYNNAFLNNLLNTMTGLSQIQKKEYGDIVSRKLGLASMETKRQVQEILSPQKFNGEGIIDSIVKQGSISRLDEVIELLGEGAFKATEAQIKTMYQAVKNMTRISKIQAAAVIWKISKAGNRKLYAPTELLPSYITADKLEAEKESYREYELKCKEAVTAEKNYNKLQKELEIKEKQKEEQISKYEETDRRFTEIKETFSELEDKKDDYIKGRKTEDESKKYYAMVNETKRGMDRLEQECERKRKRLSETEKDIQDLLSRLQTADKYQEKVNESVQQETSNRAKALQLKWQAFFFRFSFDENIFFDVVRQFQTDEIMHIEEMLKEAHDSSDIKAVTGDEQYIYAYAADKKTAVIGYEGRMITSIQKRAY